MLFEITFARIFASDFPHMLCFYYVFIDIMHVSFGSLCVVSQKLHLVFIWLAIYDYAFSYLNIFVSGWKGVTKCFYAGF